MVLQSVIVALALAMLLTTLIVGGRLLWCLVVSLRARRYWISVFSAAGAGAGVAALSAVVIVWLAYAVAHTGKDAGTDLKILLLTVPPFFLVSAGLWFLGAGLDARLESRAAGDGDKA